MPHVDVYLVPSAHSFLVSPSVIFYPVHLSCCLRLFIFSLPPFLVLIHVTFGYALVSFLALSTMTKREMRDSYLLAGGDQSIVFQLAEHVPQKVFVQLGVLLLQNNLLQLQRKVVCVAALDMALEHVMRDESHGCLAWLVEGERESVVCVVERERRKRKQQRERERCEGHRKRKFGQQCR